MKLKKPMQLKKLAVTTLLITFGTACQPVDGAAIYEKNNGEQPVQARLLAEIAVGYAKLGQQDKASKLLAPAIQTIKKNKSSFKSDLLEQLGISYIEIGQYDKALQVAKSLQVHDPGYTDFRLKHIVTLLAHVGQYDKALQVAKLISINGQRGSLNGEDFIISQSIAMSEVALKYAQTGQKAQAEQILVQALQKARDTDEMAEIALKYAQVGQKAKALQVLAQALQNAEDPTDIAQVAVKYAEVGQQAKGEQLLAQALQSIKKEENGGVKDFHLVDIAIDYAELGRRNQAIEIGKTINYPGSEAYESGFHITPEGLISGGTHPDVFAEIAKRCAEAGRYEQAFQVIQEIKWTYNKSEALGVLAVEYAKKSQYDQAFKVLKENVQYDSYKTLALTKIAPQATQVEPSAQAAQVLSQALEVAQTMKFHSDKVEVITVIAIEYTQLKQKDKSEQLLAQALQIAENMHY